MGKPIKCLYAFGRFRLDTEKRLLLCDGELVALAPKLLDILLVLVENRGELTEKEELMRRVWPGRVVEEGNLPVNIFALRKALGDDGEQNPYIKTVAKRGYRFVIPVTEVWHEKSVPEPQLPQQGSTVLPSVSALDQVTKWYGIKTPGRSLLAIMALASMGLVVLSTYLWTTHGTRHTGPAVKLQSIAVLPFKMIDAEPDDDYLGPSLADELVTSLTQLKQITVRPMTASLRYPSGSPDLVEVGRNLQVDAVLEGSIRKNGDRLRVTTQLIRVADGARLWEIKAGEEFADVKQVQQHVPAQVARALTLELTDQERISLDQSQTANPAAYHLYLKGRHLGNRMTSKDVRRGIEYFEQAIALDQNYAAAHAALATFLVLPVAAAPNSEKMPRAKAAAGRALELDEASAEAHSALALVLVYADWDWAGAERHLKRAIELNPNYIHAHHWYSLYLSAQGQHDQALAEMRWAQQIDPSSSRVNFGLGYVLYRARRYDAAIAQFSKTPLDLGPAHYQVLWGLGLSYAQKSDYEEAISTFQRAMIRTGGHPASKAFLAYSYAKSGKHGEAKKLLVELEQESGPAVLLAPVYACLGDRDKSFARLEEAYVHRDYRLINIKEDPMFDCMRPDPRFAQFLRRIGLAAGR